MRIRKSRNVVWFTGEKPLSELPGFRPRYRQAEFAGLVSTRGHSLEDRLTFAYWAMSRSSNKNGKCKDVPLALLAPALVAKWDKTTLPRAQRARNWLTENGFIILSNSGSYVIGNKSQTYYVNHAKILAWVGYMRSRGLLPKGRAWERTYESPKVIEKATKKVEKLAKKHVSMAEWKAIADKAVMGEKLHIPLFKKYELTHEQQLAYITSAAITNTPIFSAALTACNHYNSLLHPTYTVTVTTTSATRVGSDEPSYRLLSVYNPKNGDSESISQEIAKINPPENREKFYEVYKLLGLHCRPHVHVSANAIVTGVSFRAYSGATLLSSHNRRNRGKFEGSDRQIALDSAFGRGNYCCIDRSCSISHINMCLTWGCYIPNGVVDMYEILYRKGVGGDLLPEKRSAFKKTINRVFFTKSARLYSSQVARSEGSYRDGYYRCVLEEEYESLRWAYDHYCGKPLGVPIFFFESLLMVLTQTYLLEHYGLRSANVYDALYIENGNGRYTAEDLKEMMEKASDAVFPEVLKFHKGRPAYSNYCGNL